MIHMNRQNEVKQKGKERKVGVGYYLNTLESVSTREKVQVEESKETFMCVFEIFPKL